MAGDIIEDIDYYSSTNDGSPPWLVTLSLPATVRSNIIPAPVPVTIHDLRDKENSVNLDTHGLELTKYNGSIQHEFEEGSEAQQIYYKEISEYLKQRLGASRVIIYHYTFRSRGSPSPDEQCNHTHRNPVFYPHIDIDSVGVQAMVEKEVGAQAMKHRVQVINVWRPLGSSPILDKPLAICDYRSIDVDHDVHSLSIRGAGFHSTAYTLSRNAQDAHLWYYLSQMRSDEIFLFKIFDNKPNVAQFGFHTAFTKNHGPATNEEQKSLELRCLILHNE